MQVIRNIVIDEVDFLGSDVVERIATAGPGERMRILSVDCSGLSEPTKSLIEVAQELIREGRDTALPTLIEASNGRLAIDVPMDGSAAARLIR